MSSIQVENLTKSFGTDELFEPFTAQVSPGDRIALIGDNGVGKTTLLRLLTGSETPTSGRVHLIGDVCIGYLPQMARLDEEGTLWTAMEQPFSRLRDLEAELRRLETQLAASDDPKLAHRYDDLLHQFTEGGGYEIEARIRSALIGVGFHEAEIHAPIGSLSGGEEARAALARVLLEKPDLLLLDEPTNHLDFAALDWLEETLATFSGALIVVSHDRHLLERIANRTWEISFGRVMTYRLGFGESREVRATERERQLNQFRRQEETIDRYKDFIRRHKAGQKHRQAMDRAKKLKRIEEARVDRPREAKRIALRISVASSSGKRVLSSWKTEIGYNAPFLSCPDLDLYRGQKVAVIGPNGCGKTTLLRTIAGETPPLSGSCKLGHGVRIAFFRQSQDDLFNQDTVLDTILARSPLTVSQARSHLGRFLFSGADVGKKTSALSGGERSRVALALLSLMEGNLLLLDEPTNHLDLASQEILETALQEYEGTILLVSHDRALLETVTTQVWIIAAGRLRVHTYGYAEYRRRQQEANQPTPVSPKPATKKSRSANRTDRFQLRRKAAAFREVEQRIESLEARLAELESELVTASRDGDGARIASLGTEHKRVEDELSECYTEWRSATANLD
jgi:ATP-binding cassette subfamily F protein 3